VIYGTTTEATDYTEKDFTDWRYRLIRAVFFFVPRANPDAEPLFPKVRAWAIELSEDGWPQREVGLDSKNLPLFALPNQRNTGFWTDMAHKRFEAHELKLMTAEAFEALWASQLES